MSTSSPADPPLPLERLNAAERTVLALLAEGHTAKSIAAQTGRTVGAVNERLREARRKTGMGSSRELARLLKAQESRDEQIGVPPSPPAAEAVPAGAMGLRLRKGWLSMLFIGLAGAAALLAFQTTSPGLAADPRLSKLLPAEQQRSPKELHDALTFETRDLRWAPAAEELLRAAYGEAAARDGLTGISVHCGRTLCEVIGTISPPPDQVDAAYKDLQGPVPKAIGAGGLRMETMMFGSDNVFAAWWSRSTPGQPA